MLTEYSFWKNLFVSHWTGIFFTVWLTPLIILIWIGISLVKIHKTEVVSDININDQQNEQEKPQVRNLYLVLAIVVFISFLSSYIYLILDRVDLPFPDEFNLTLYSLRGRLVNPPIIPPLGRFYPLGFQDYNLISIFSKTTLAYYLFSIFQLLIVIPLIYLILPKSNILYKLLTIVIIMTTPSFVVPVFGTVFFERNIILLLALFIVCLQQYTKEKNRLTLYFCLILISVHLSLYYKETMFLLIGGFAVSRLIIKLSNTEIFSGWSNYKRIIKSNYLEISLIILSAIYIILYLLLMLGRVDSPYLADERDKLTYLSTFIFYIKNDFILLAFIVTFPLRMTYLFLSKKIPDLIWDSLSIGAILYFAAFIILKLVALYYIAPVDFIATLYLFTLIFRIGNVKVRINSLIILVFSTILLVQNIPLSSNHILSRRKFTEANVQVVEYLKSYSNSHKNKDQINLFIPESIGYQLGTFSSFLYWKGFDFPVYDKIIYGKSINTSPKLPRIVISSDKQYPNDLCVSFLGFNCYYNNEENSDLIILLPPYLSGIPNREYEEKIIELKAKQDYVLLYHYQPKFENIEKILLLVSKENISNKYFNFYVFKKA